MGCNSTELTSEQKELIYNDFVTFFKEFNEEQLKLVKLFIDTYKCYYNFDYNGCHKLAILYLLAHLVSVNNPTSNTGSNVGNFKNVSSMSVGNVSMSFESTQGLGSGGLSSFYGSSKYGMQFLMLINKNAISIMYV